VTYIQPGIWDFAILVYKIHNILARSGIFLLFGIAGLWTIIITVVFCQKLNWPKCLLDETNAVARQMTDLHDNDEVLYCCSGLYQSGKCACPSHV